jgi:hypothetical protein
MAELPHVMGHQIARPLPIGCATTRTPCRNVIFSADLFWLLSRLRAPICFEQLQPGSHLCAAQRRVDRVSGGQYVSSPESLLKAALRASSSVWDHFGIRALNRRRGASRRGINERFP